MVTDSSLRQTTNKITWISVDYSIHQNSHCHRVPPPPFTKEGNMLSFVPSTGRRLPLISCLQRKHFLQSEMWAVMFILQNQERAPTFTVAPIAVNHVHIKVNHNQGPLKRIKQCLLNVYLTFAGQICYDISVLLYKCKTAVFLDGTVKLLSLRLHSVEYRGGFFLFFSASNASRRSHLSDASSPNASLPLPLPPCAALLCSGPGLLGAAERFPSIHSEPNACVTASPPSPF